MFILKSTHDAEIHKLLLEIAGLKGELMSAEFLRQELNLRISEADGELSMVDQALARRAAVDGLLTRYDKICAAFAYASRAERQFSATQTPKTDEAGEAFLKDKINTIDIQINLIESVAPITMADHRRKHSELLDLRTKRTALVEKSERHAPEVVQVALPVH